MEPAKVDLRRRSFDKWHVNADLGHVAEAVETADAFLDLHWVGWKVEEDQMMCERKRATLDPGLGADEHTGRSFVLFGEALNGTIAHVQR